VPLNLGTASAPNPLTDGKIVNLTPTASPPRMLTKVARGAHIFPASRSLTKSDDGQAPATTANPSYSAMHRRLRIAVTALVLTAALLFAALWCAAAADRRLYRFRSNPPSSASARLWLADRVPGRLGRYTLTAAGLSQSNPIVHSSDYQLNITRPNTAHVCFGSIR